MEHRETTMEQVSMSPRHATHRWLMRLGSELLRLLRLLRLGSELLLLLLPLRLLPLRRLPRLLRLRRAMTEAFDEGRSALP
jgi:hypothetical protein